jgi:hypothetical protein
MANEEKKNEQGKKPSRVKQMDTTKAGVRAYLDKAAEKTKESFHAGSTLKRAAISYAADCAGLEGEERAEFAKQLDSTPGFFMCGNNSACKQAYDAKTVEGVSGNYTDY